MIVVTGATGSTGSEVVRALLARGHRVRVFARDPGKAHALFGAAVEVARGDFADPEAVRAALEHAQGVVLSAPDDPRRVAWETGLIDAAAAEGVRRIVKLSTIGADPEAPAAFWAWHGLVEAHLRRCGLPAVVLRSAPYMSNLLAGAEAVAREGRLYAPAGRARIAMIDPRDVGAAVAAAATTDGHDGRTYVLTGPEAITYAQVAAELAAATGGDVEYVEVDDDQARQAMVQQGLPDVAAREIVNVFAMLRQGAAEPVTAAVRELTGRAPRGVAAFARDHADAFAPAAVGAGR
jgi:uncharacterized protein YbjT (DUF2867 family)